MSSRIVFQADLNKYKALNWYGKAVYKRYAQIKNYISRKLGAEYASILAEPLFSEKALRSGGKGTWSSDQVSDQAIPFTQLSPAEQSRARGIIDARMGAIVSMGEEQSISTNPEEKNWGELLLSAIQFPDDSHILVEGDDFVLVAWGFDMDPAFTEPYKPAEFIAQVDPVVPEEEEIEEIIEEEIPTPFEIHSQNWGEEEEEDQIPLPPPPPASGSPWTFLRRAAFWIPFLLALLIGIAYWYIQDQGLLDRNLLPPTMGKIVPIDEDKIGPDPSEGIIVAIDRLNVALVGNNQDYKTFAEKFKETYPQRGFKIIYYDTLAFPRLQIKVPLLQDRETVKKELKDKFREFELLTWYESIFNRINWPQGQDFKDPSKNWYLDEIQLPDAWDYGNDDSSSVIAVIDDGFDLSHPEFQGKLYKEKNIPNPGAPFNYDKDRWHGTHVAAIASGNADNSLGLCGIARNSRIMPIQVGDESGMISTTAIIDGFLYAIYNGADVINLSLGKAMFTQALKNLNRGEKVILMEAHEEEEEFWNELFALAIKKGSIPVIAAGNDDLEIGFDPMHRSKNAIIVSATDKNGRKAQFSNYGSRSTISAPGVDIYSAKPEGQFGYSPGTSMAAPIVAGSIALIKSQGKKTGFEEIKKLIKETGRPVNSGNDNVGELIQLENALRGVPSSRPTRKKKKSSILEVKVEFRPTGPPNLYKKLQ